MQFNLGQRLPLDLFLTTDSCKIAALVGVQAHGPATCLAFITTMKTGVCHKGLEKTKHQLFALSLKNILGENIPDLNLKIAVLVDQLECAGALDPEHVPKIVPIYKTCTEP